MRDNPLKSGVKEGLIAYQGDNFVRHTGDTRTMAELQMFAWQAADRGADVHLQADPTRGELLHREFKDKKEVVKDQVRNSILETYGGAEHLAAPPPELLVAAQSEHYVEYSRSGRVIKGQMRATPRSKYEEDVLTNRHTTVYGSYWEEGRWGYKCCQQFLRNAYCTAL